MLTLARRSDTSLQVRVLMVAIAAAALLAIDARPAAAATVLYVDKNNPSCSDTGSGTSTQPYCSIAPAAKVATTGQTVQVASGTYNELVSVGKSGGAGAPVVYTAAPGATVTVGSGVANGFKVSTKSNVTIQGFSSTSPAARTSPSATIPSTTAVATASTSPAPRPTSPSATTRSTMPAAPGSTSPAPRRT